MQGLCAQVAGQQAMLPTLPGKGLSQGLGLVRTRLCSEASWLHHTAVLPAAPHGCIQIVVQSNQTRELWLCDTLRRPHAT